MPLERFSILHYLYNIFSITFRHHSRVLPRTGLRLELVLLYYDIFSCCKFHFKIISVVSFSYFHDKLFSLLSTLIYFHFDLIDVANVRYIY